MHCLGWSMGMLDPQGLYGGSNVSNTMCGTKIVLTLSMCACIHTHHQYFNNEAFEAEEYDKILGRYESASLKTTTSLSLLSFTQSAVFSCALTAVMVMTSQGIVQGMCVCGAGGGGG